MSNNYELCLSYNPEQDNISDSFIFLAKVIKGQAKSDNILISGIENKDIHSEIILTDIQHSSIRTILANTLRNTKEEAIQEKGLTALWRQFLIEAKTPFLEYASSHENLESRQDLLSLKQQLASIARANNINPLPIEGLSDDQIYNCLEGYAVPSEHLGQNQSYTARCNGRDYVINRNFNPTREALGEIEETHQNQNIFLKPRKICYTGDSMWEFTVQNGSTVKGKILDKDWLSDFQNNRLSHNKYPFPTTLISVNADVVIKYDAAGSRKETTVYVKNILDVSEIGSLTGVQGKLFE